jgi:phage shock protein C
MAILTIHKETEMSMADELMKLQTLHQQGALTDSEYTAAKQRVLAGNDASASRMAQNKATPSAAQSGLQRLERSLTDRWIGGVCGGLAATTNIPTWSWRVLFILATLLHGLGILMYVLMWVFVPLEPQRIYVHAAAAPASPAAPSPVQPTAPVTPESSVSTGQAESRPQDEPPRS